MRKVKKVKMKTVKSIASKFRVTGTGRLKRSQPGVRHHLGQKTPKRKRQLRKSALVSHTQEQMYAQLIGV